MADDLTWLSGKVVCITGGTNGIGKSFLEQICVLPTSNRPAKVVLLARNAQLAKNVSDRVVEAGIACDQHIGDLGEPKDVTRMVQEIIRGNTAVHCLMNHGGVWLADSKRVVLPNGLEAHYAVNYLSMAVLITGLLPLMRTSGTASDPARIVVTGSGLYMVFAKGVVDFGNLQRENGEVNMGGDKGLASGMAYAHSKTLQYSWCKHLASTLSTEDDHVTLNLVSPGACLTPNQPIFSNCKNAWWLLRGALYRTPYQGAEPLVHCAASTAMNGVHDKYVDWGTWKFYYPKRRPPFEMEVQPGDTPLSPNAVSPSVSDPAQCKRLFEETQKTIDRYNLRGSYVPESVKPPAASLSGGGKGFVDDVLVKPFDTVLVKPLKGVTKGSVDAVVATRKLLLEQTAKLVEALQLDGKDRKGAKKGTAPATPEVDATLKASDVVATAA